MIIQKTDFYLNPVLFVLWEVTPDSTGFPPLKLLLTAQLNGVLSLYSDLITNKESSPTVRDIYSYILELKERIISSCNLAQHALQISGQKSRDYANKNRKLVKFIINEKVIILLPDH